MLEGVPLYPTGSIKRKFLEALPTPPPPTPSEATDKEEPLPLTQKSSSMEEDAEYTPLTLLENPRLKESKDLTGPLEA